MAGGRTVGAAGVDVGSAVKKNVDRMGESTGGILFVCGRGAAVTRRQE